MKYAVNVVRVLQYEGNLGAPVEGEVYRQVVETLDLPALIAVVNKQPPRTRRRAPRGDLFIALGVDKTLEASLLRREAPAVAGATASGWAFKGDGETQVVSSSPAEAKPKRGRRKMAAAVDVPSLPKWSEEEMARQQVIMEGRKHGCHWCKDRVPLVEDDTRHAPNPGKPQETAPCEWVE